MENKIREIMKEQLDQICLKNDIISKRQDLMNVRINQIENTFRDSIGMLRDIPVMSQAV